MEFSQRPTHSTTLPGAHAYMAAATTSPTHAHRAYATPDLQQQQQHQAFYSSSPYMHHQQQHASDSYLAASRRLPSVSELLVVSQATAAAQQQAVAGHSAPNSYSSASIIPSKPFGIDVPSARSAAQHNHYAITGHRDSESASSVSSQATLLDNYSPPPPSHQRAFSQHEFKDSARVYRPPGDADCDPHDQDEVYTAASILMSLRACKMPC
ncbi:hypothetical protein GGI20_003129 [Coemansia sp. BCRC 34301]|nr:hypothetical protein GGI20_003129 [Coemansia sp. BCRC 34301]